MDIFWSSLKIPSFREIWVAFRDSFLVEQSYENVNTGSMISLPFVVLGIFVGVAIALFAAVFNKRFLGEAVRKLLDAEALSSDSAKTLEELGIGKNFLLRHAVKGNVSLRRVVRCREEDEFLRVQEEASETADESGKQSRALKKHRARPFRVDPNVHHFYIPEEWKDMASTKFNQKGTSIGSLILLLVLLLVTLIVILIALPYIMGLLDDFAGTMKSATDVRSDKIV